MALVELYSMNGVVVSTTEVSIVSGTTTLQSVTTDGVYQLYVDASNMAKGDEFRIRVKEKAIATGAQQVVAEWTLSGAQSQLFVTPTLILLHGWDMTIVKLAGTDRAFSASIRQVA